MARFRIVHMTSLTYDRPVQASHNEVRMSPLTEDSQHTVDNRIRVQPMTWSHVYRDYWGTMVSAIECVGSHTALHVESISTVDTGPRNPVPDSPGWEALTDPVRRDHYYEWLTETDRTRPGDGIREVIEQARTAPTPRAAADHICAQVNQEMTYQRGVTGVHSTSEQAWDDKRGVCQDFAHIVVGALRALQVPARYVSGYLAPEAGLAVGQSAVGESHAWVEFWDGAWLAVDPTNLSPVGEEHVVVARGRDYEDVPPFKGVYTGAAVSDLSVSVEFSRLT